MFAQMESLRTFSLNVCFVFRPLSGHESNKLATNANIDRKILPKHADRFDIVHSCGLTAE